MNTLTVRDLHVKRGPNHILRGVDLTVAPGEICVLMGASGGGKSGFNSSRPPRVNAKLLPRTSTT